MLDGEHMPERCVVMARAITTDETKKPVGLWDGSTENITVGSWAGSRTLMTQGGSGRHAGRRVGGDF